MPLFASFVHLLANKPMAKWSKASGQSSRGLWVKNRAEMWLFFLSNLEFIPINLIMFQVPPVQFWSPLRSFSLGLIPTVIFEHGQKYLTIIFSNFGHEQQNLNYVLCNYSTFVNINLCNDKVNAKSRSNFMISIR